MNGEVIGKGWYALMFIPETKIVAVRETYERLKKDIGDMGVSLEDMLQTGKWIVFMVDLVENG